MPSATVLIGRVSDEPGIVMLACGLAAGRGWYFAGVAAVVYGVMAAAMAISPQRVIDWSRRGRHRARQSG